MSMCVGCMCINSVLLTSYFAGTIWSVVPQGLLWKQCHGTWKEQLRNSCLLLLVGEGLIVHVSQLSGKVRPCSGFRCS